MSDLADVLHYVVECKSTYPFFETIAAFNVQAAANSYMQDCQRANPQFQYRFRYVGPESDEDMGDDEVIVPCVDGTENHKFVVADDNENICYCERCGCYEY